MLSRKILSQERKRKNWQYYSADGGGDAAKPDKPNSSLGHGGNRWKERTDSHKLSSVHNTINVFNEDNQTSINL